MARTPRSSRSEEDDELDEEDEEEEPRRRSRRPPSRHPRGTRRDAPRRWRGPDEEGDEELEDEEDEEEDDSRTPRSGRGSGPRKKFPVFWRARDSLYFEPLVGLAIIIVLLVSLYAYTSNWPPVYVVESDSMQHGLSDQLGLINTGDLVLAQKVSASDITPYVVGLVTGYSTYGEYGDVLLYHPNGNTGVTPVIHRAIVFLQYNPATSTSGSSYSVPELAQLPAGSCGGTNPVYATPGTPGGCATSDLTGTLELFHIGWRSLNLSIDLSSPGLGGHSGYLTLGDNNLAVDQSGSPVPQVSSLVEPGWILGVARGMIPWFGSLKLLLEGNAGMVPPQSWQFLGLTVAGLILLAFAIHYALRAEGIETPLRKEEEEEEEAEEQQEAHRSPDGPEGRPHRWLTSLRPWSAAEEEDEEDEVEPRPRHHPSNHGAVRTEAGSRRGRPRPRVRRSERSARRRKNDDL